MTSSPVLAILKLQHEKVRISVKNKLMSKISSYVKVSGLGSPLKRVCVRWTQTMPAEIRRHMTILPWPTRKQMKVSWSSPSNSWSPVKEMKYKSLTNSNSWGCFLTRHNSFIKSNKGVPLSRMFLYSHLGTVSKTCNHIK